MSTPLSGELETQVEQVKSKRPSPENSFLKDPNIPARTKLEQMAFLAEHITPTTGEKKPNQAEQQEQLAGRERITEEPKDEAIKDAESAAKEVSMSDQDQKDAQAEREYIADLLQRYPEDQRHPIDTSNGIDCIYLGTGEMPPQLIESITRAKAVLRQKFGDKLPKIFEGLKIYYVRGEKGLGGGKARSWANAITMDVDNNSLTIAQAEQMLGPDGAGILEPGDWERVAGADTI